LILSVPDEVYSRSALVDTSAGGTIVPEGIIASCATDIVY